MQVLPYELNLMLFLLPFFSVGKAQHLADPNPIVRNRRLIYQFLASAYTLLANAGEIHITSKDVMPYTYW